jgi:hypothetical protein
MEKFYAVWSSDSSHSGPECVSDAVSTDQGPTYGTSAYTICSTKESRLSRILSCQCQACVRLTSGLSGLPDLTDLMSGLTDDEHFDMYVGMLAFVYTCV